MIASDGLPGDMRTADIDRSIEAASTLAAPRPAMGNRRFGASLGSLVFEAGHMGAGLGWHGWHRPVASSGPLVDFDDVEFLETIS
jgi:hypothetical protein